MAVDGRYPLGAELRSPSDACIRLWAPNHDAVQVVVDGRSAPMSPEPGGFFSADVQARQGSRYGFRLSNDAQLYPDPASRWQPDGPEGLSSIVDLATFPWRDDRWPGTTLAGQVIYELHVGTFTASGTWQAAEAVLPRLRDLGITVLQVMPIAEFAGDFGWGYDGVQWFAPMHRYGTPTDLQHFVDEAHHLGLAVLLDVVYNHLGPSGNHLRRFAACSLSDRHRNEWGDALNFDAAGSDGLRQLVLSNVAYWIREFHIDGFRLDAAQQLFDDSPEHIIAAVARTARATAAPRSIVLLAEHEPQHARLVRAAAEGGYGLDAIYNEDLHHSTRVALTGVHEAYLSDYSGESREWLAATQFGVLFQGQFYPWQDAPRGAPALDRHPGHFVSFLENHDQVANAPSSRRLVDLTSPSWFRAMSAFLLLGPWTPLIFQGQEWGARQPFRYFADLGGDLQDAVLSGRSAFISQFSRYSDTSAAPVLLDDIGRPAFERSRLQHEMDDTAQAFRRLYRDLIALRRAEPAFGGGRRPPFGATLGDRILILRFATDRPLNDRLVVVNLEADRNVASVSDPLVAPPADCQWRVHWCSEEPQYGGGGVVASAPPARVLATGHATTVFRPEPRSS